MRLIIIPPQGAPAFIYVAGKAYDNMRAIVGGILAYSGLTENVGLYYDDEGLLKGLQPNLLTNTGTMFVGNIIATRVNEEGDETDATDADLALVERFVKECRRPGRVEYDIPPARIYTSLEEMRAAGPMPSVGISGITDVVTSS